jgi:NAD(P)-dependent dehydrogenase (short-subunit alcohol dehydrogenase family)
MHASGRANVADLDWNGRRPTASYSDSKLLLTTFAMAVARLWPNVYSNAVDPGWVPTKMVRPRPPRQPPARAPDSGVARHQRRT